jgi:TonB family protein
MTIYKQILLVTGLLFFYTSASSQNNHSPAKVGSKTKPKIVIIKNNSKSKSNFRIPEITADTTDLMIEEMNNPESKEKYIDAGPTSASDFSNESKDMRNLDIAPEFPGGEEGWTNFIKKNLNYPKLAIEQGIQGKVIVKCIIKKDGNINNIHFSNNLLGGGCEDEAYRLVKLMPKWEPGYKNGVFVDAEWEISIPFVFTYKERAFEVVKIGKQTWMKKNLDVIYFRNGDSIPEAKTEEEFRIARVEKKPVWCHINLDSTNDLKYGKYYNWYAVNDKRGLAPMGWRIPSESDWWILRDLVGQDLIDGGANKLKSASDDWIYDSGKSCKGNDSTGFSGLPCGAPRIGRKASWWSSSKHSYGAYRIELLAYGSHIYGGAEDFSNCLSVRCIQDSDQTISENVDSINKKRIDILIDSIAGEWDLRSKRYFDEKGNESIAHPTQSKADKLHLTTITFMDKSTFKITETCYACPTIVYTGTYFVGIRTLNLHKQFYISLVSKNNEDITKEYSGFLTSLENGKLIMTNDANKELKYLRKKHLYKK